MIKHHEKKSIKPMKYIMISFQKIIKKYYSDFYNLI